MNRWVDDPMNEKNKSIASQENYYKGLNQGCMKMKGWRFIAKLSGMVVDKILEETEDGINITNRRLVFTCCYNGPIKHSGALWLGTGPLSQGLGEGLSASAPETRLSAPASLQALALWCYWDG